MSKSTGVLAAVMLLALGAGCSAPNLPGLSLFPDDLAAADIRLAGGSEIHLEQSSLNPLERLKTQPTRVIKLTDWTPNVGVALTWSETYERETSESIAARSQAERATGVGEDSNIPKAVFETITQEGSIKTDALADGHRILLPSEWTENDIDLSGSGQTIVWLSQEQYTELSDTRHTHLAIGVFDAGLQTAMNAADSVKELIEKISGGSDAGALNEQDITEIVAEAEWGSYVLNWQGQKVRVQTIEAENKFAHYTILANPENPLILEVQLKPWAYGTEALGFISDELEISGYTVTSITTP